MKPKPNTKTKEEFLKHLNYCPLSGEFRWNPRSAEDFPHDNFRNRWNARCVGNIAGFIAYNGYRHIDVCGVRVLAHRLAMFVTSGEWPEGDVDHINGSRDDNRIANLRVVRRFENLQNSKLRSNNTSGVKGVSLRKGTNKWIARLRQNKGPYLYLGSFDNIEDATKAVEDARKRLHGKFANHG